VTQLELDQLVEIENEELRGLLARVGKREQGAIRALYLAYSSRVYAFALNRLHDPAAAEEVVGDTMLEVWKHPERFRGESRFSTWLLGIARHKVLNALRSREPEHAELDELAEQVPAPDPDGFDALARKQKIEALQHCMDRLPPEQRECLYLTLFEEMPLQEIGRLQGCPENTVKTRLFHARQKVRDCLRQFAIEEA
jgi:RNA polymerase sigma-70 factor, ECF subfamily